MQETHSKIENRWKTEWGSEIWFSHGTCNTNGVVTPFPKDSDNVLRYKMVDLDGRLLLVLQITLNNTHYTITIVYAPTRDHRIQQLEFISKVKQQLALTENETILMGGDFNFYMSKSIDKVDSMSTFNDKSEYQEEVKTMLESFNLVDSWRVIYPDVRRYTWHARGLASRLDYLFISEHLLNVINAVDINPGLFSDHGILQASFEISSGQDKGRGIWKFNNTLLHDQEYVKEIKSLIETTYLNVDHLEDKILKWEVIKMKIRLFTNPYILKRWKEQSVFKDK